jgi:hypothetical protein
VQEGVEKIDLLASLDGEWLKLPLDVMRDVGPAVQTLGGLLKLTLGETYVRAALIAGKARVPLPTARKHLKALADHEWIENAGRGRTRYGAPRRTCTLRIAARTHEALKHDGDLIYGVLPWWACCTVSGVGRLSWASRAVLSIVMARLMALRAAVDRNDGHGCDALDTWGSIENLGGEDRFAFSLSRLVRETGLTRESLVAAKRELAQHKIIAWRDNTDGRADILWPSEDFRVIVTPAGEGRCYLAFQG